MISDQHKMSSPKKYIYKPNHENDSNHLMSPCLAIDPNVELKDVPTTGEEYILKMIKEREKYATVTICNKDLSKFARNQSCFVKELPHPKAPDNLKPTIEWQNIQVADFSEVRIYLSRLLHKKSLWPHEDNKIDVKPNSTENWKNLFETRDPKLSCVLGLHNVVLDRGLEVLTEILDDVKPGSTIDHKIGQWIYAFLACTRQPLLSDSISILRTLARKCAKIRSCLNPEDEDLKMKAAPLNIFICLISRYFRQYDLAD